jgi:hypothetical protein
MRAGLIDVKYFEVKGTRRYREEGEVLMDYDRRLVNDKARAIVVKCDVKITMTMRLQMLK